jgi:hypothetical protein
VTLTPWAMQTNWPLLRRLTGGGVVEEDGG